MLIMNALLRVVFSRKIMSAKNEFARISTNTAINWFTRVGKSAIDSALYTKEVLTVGSRYYGDTYTDPNTL